MKQPSKKTVAKSIGIPREGGLVRFNDDGGFYTDLSDERTQQAFRRELEHLKDIKVKG